MADSIFFSAASSSRTSSGPILASLRQELYVFCFLNLSYLRIFFSYFCFRCLFVYALTMFSAVPMGDHDKMAQDVYFGKRWLALDLF